MGRLGQQCRVDIVEKSPAPFGLVRYGVAPDHPGTKEVERSLGEILEDGRASFFGNVAVGKDVSVDELRARYSAVVLACGAPADKELGVPGERELAGVTSARRFVGWYNGSPEDRDEPIEERLRAARTALIVGLGNVSVDCARVLLRSPRDLAKTDMCQHAVDALARSSIERVILAGRRGPAQAAYTAREIRELTNMAGVHVWSPENEVGALFEADKEELRRDRARRRAHEAVSKAVEAWRGISESETSRSLHLRFLQSPISINPSKQDDSVVGSVTLRANELGGEAGKRVSKPLKATEDVDADIVIRSIGYKAVPIEGVPFDHRAGAVPHYGGRVLSETGTDSVQPGLYVCGWLKRGPTGVISTNLMCAEDTVNSVVEDCEQGRVGAPTTGEEEFDGIELLLRHRGVRYVTLDGWHRIDHAEREAGSQRGAPREKFTSVESMLQAAGC